MTLEELLEMPVEQLKKMTDKELEEHFKHFFPITRPELAQKPEKTSTVRSMNSSKKGMNLLRQSKFDMISGMAKSLGIDLGELDE